MGYRGVSPFLVGISNLGSVYHETCQGLATGLSFPSSLDVQAFHREVRMENHRGDRVADDRRTKIDLDVGLSVRATSL
jgi:hypothetical protein